MSGFKIGDRVLIVDRDHPWAEHAGEISERFHPGPVREGGASPAGPLAWTVRLDGAYMPRCAVAEGQIVRAASVGHRGAT